MTAETQALTDNILALDANNAENELAMNLAAAFCAQVSGARSIDMIREQIRRNGFDHPGMVPFWQEVAQGVIAEFLEEFQGTDACSRED